MDWQALEEIPADRLWAARTQIHWALQPMASVGNLLVPHQPDFSEQSFQWSEDDQCLCQSKVKGATTFRAALRLSPPALLLLTEADETPRAMPLTGVTLDDAYRWVEHNVADLLGKPLAGPLERPSGFPDHPFADGAPFDAADRAAFHAIATLFCDANLALSGWAARRAETPGVLCWPHHLDLAALLTLELGDDGEASRSVGVGMVPGDEGRRDPYFYVTPWPRPEATEPLHPALPSGGVWNTEGWFGAVLPIAALSGLERREQEAAVGEFLRQAVLHCEDLARQLPLKDPG
jgi:hypothetical protein